MSTGTPLITQLEDIVGRRFIIGCPKFCHGGRHGMDACNMCGQTGSGFRLNGKFYPNTEHGWRAALDTVRY